MPHPLPFTGSIIKPLQDSSGAAQHPFETKTCVSGGTTGLFAASRVQEVLQLGSGGRNLILLYSPPAKSLLIIRNLQKPWEEESNESMSFFWKSACATACEVMSSGAHTLCCLQGFGLCPELPQPHSLWDPRTGASKLPAQPAACTSLQTVLTEHTLRLGFRKSGFGSQLNHAFLSWCDSD